MAYQIPTLAELTTQFITNFESALGQTAPIPEKAYLRVESALQAAIASSIYRFASSRAKQALATTADEDGLKAIGAEYNVVRTPAVAANLTAEIDGTPATVIYSTNTFTGDANGEIYYLDANATVAGGGTATLSLTAKEAGISGNLNAGDTLTIGSQVAGVDTVATVTAVNTLGADEEDLEAYRERVLTAIRGRGLGGNAANYRQWAEQTPNVIRAYPYSGQPVILSSLPGDRTVYIEADPDYEPDGIADQDLLDAAREYISFDPSTGYARPPLGMTDETLWVESISRTEIFVTITSLDVEADQEANAKADIESALESHLRGLRCFVDGLDAEAERQDKITPLTIGKVVQGVLYSYGGSAAGVSISLSLMGAYIDAYELERGELGDLGGVAYD